MIVDAHGIILLVIAALELLFVYYLWHTRSKGHVLYSFAGFAVSVVVWVGGNGLHRLVLTNKAAFFWTDVNHMAAMLIAIFFLYFSWAFPCLVASIKIKKVVLLIAPAVIFFCLMFFTNTIIQDVTGPNNNRYQVNGPLYHLYAVVFLAYFISALTNLFKRYKSSGGDQKWQLGALLIGLIGSGTFGTLFDLFLPWFGGPQYFYIGPESSVIWLGFVSYIVFSKR